MILCLLRDGRSGSFTKKEIARFHRKAVECAAQPEAERVGEREVGVSNLHLRICAQYFVRADPDAGGAWEGATERNRDRILRSNVAHGGSESLFHQIDVRLGDFENLGKDDG